MASHNSYLPNYSFEVRIDGSSFGFSKVNNISAGIEFDTIVNGGSNDAPVILPKPKRTADMIVFEKGLKADLSDTMFSLLTEGKKVGGIMIFVKLNGSIKRIFSISTGVIIKREFSPLDAMGDQVFLEALQIAHTGLTEIALPF
jgi:T4-like virus tail tube protein gp19.